MISKQFQPDKFYTDKLDLVTGSERPRLMTVNQQQVSPLLIPVDSVVDIQPRYQLLNRTKLFPQYSTGGYQRDSNFVIKYSTFIAIIL